MNPQLLLAIPLLPLGAAILAGLGGRLLGRGGAAFVAIAGVAVSCALATRVLWQSLHGVPVYDAPVYTWLLSDTVHMQVGFLVDRLTALMMVVVTFVSLCVHVYTMGYMSDDPGYQRFFAYIALFTFAMLMLVMANNFLQLFFGWEAVGVVSYLLIGFWYTRPSAIFANLKAFLVNRVGDFGFLLGIAGVLYYTGSLDYPDAIKRVVAYSTLSQLGYMTVALGVSAYSIAIFHLMTHAFFKALLFLAAGAVIIALHHEQDMRKMGGLRARMPVTYWTSLIGALALIGTPFFSGFYSKDALIEAVHASHRAGAGYAYFCVTVGVFVTAYYTFRMIFMTFHGPSRLDTETEAHFHDVGWDMKGPLVALAIPSLLIGFFTIEPVLFGGDFGSAVKVLEANDVVAGIGQEFHGAAAFALHGLSSPPLRLAAAGLGSAWAFVPGRT